MRLQKILSQAGICSRRKAEELILSGRVKVNGEIISELGKQFDINVDKIFVDDKPIKLVEEKIYILLNKPKNIISAVSDDRGRKTVIDLIDINERIYPVGRLDFDTEGLILLTNDGELMNSLLHPKFEINKTYVAKISGEINESKLNQLRNGIELEDGLTAPAIIRVIGKSSTEAKIEVTIHEGRNRQVRRMFAAIGCEVKSLRRTRFANLTTHNLKVGEYRKLIETEIQNLKMITGMEI